MSEPFKAQFNSACLKCDQPINEGDWVIYEEGQVIHLGCKEDNGE